MIKESIQHYMKRDI